MLYTFLEKNPAGLSSRKHVAGIWLFCNTGHSSVPWDNSVPLPDFLRCIFTCPNGACIMVWSRAKPLRACCCCGSTANRSTVNHLRLPLWAAESFAAVRDLSGSYHWKQSLSFCTTSGVSEMIRGSCFRCKLKVGGRRGRRSWLRGQTLLTGARLDTNCNPSLTRAKS